jgi:histidyl-tRNA synthetase
MPFSTPRGTHDILPDEARRWQWLEAKFRHACALAGFGEIHTPMFEETDLFARGVGEDTDIVTKQMYSFTSPGNDRLTLRPEGTAGVVRAAIQHNLLVPGSVEKVYYAGPIFRYERPAKGRFRQFAQLGVEVFGAPGPDVDAELLAFASDFLAEIGLTTALEVNSVGCLECRPRYRDTLRNALAGARTELCPDCLRRYDSNPLRILDCKVERCRELSADVPVILDVLCEPCKVHLAGVEEGLRALDVPFVVNPHIVRGLDYYTRTAFEFIGTNLGAQSTVLAGGRYDGLVEELGGPATPGIGFAAGVERLLLSVGDAAGDAEEPGVVYLAALAADARPVALQLATALRRAGVPAAFDYLGRSLKAQMREANRLGAWYVVILGGDEIARGEAALRDMRGATQSALDLDGLVPYFQHAYAGHPVTVDGE